MLTRTAALQLVADGHVYPAKNATDRRLLASLCARGYLRRVARAVYAITETGREVLAEEDAIGGNDSAKPADSSSMDEEALYAKIATALRTSIERQVSTTKEGKELTAISAEAMRGLVTHIVGNLTYTVADLITTQGETP